MASWLLTEILSSVGVAAEKTDIRNCPELGIGKMIHEICAYQTYL